MIGIARADATGGTRRSGSCDRAWAWRPDGPNSTPPSPPLAPRSADPEGGPVWRQPTARPSGSPIPAMPWPMRPTDPAPCAGGSPAPPGRAPRSRPAHPMRSHRQSPRRTRRDRGFLSAQRASVVSPRAAASRRPGQSAAVSSSQPSPGSDSCRRLPTHPAPKGNRRPCLPTARNRSVRAASGSRPRAPRSAPATPRNRRSGPNAPYRRPTPCDTPR